MFEKFFNKAKDAAKEFVDETIAEKGNNLEDAIEAGILLGGLAAGLRLMLPKKKNPVYIIRLPFEPEEDDNNG